MVIGAGFESAPVAWDVITNSVCLRCVGGTSLVRERVLSSDPLVCWAAHLFSMCSLTGHKSIVASVRMVDEDLSLVVTSDITGLFKLWSVARTPLGFAPCLFSFTSHPLHPIVPKCVHACVSQ
jgi:hypothetical protein